MAIGSHGLQGKQNLYEHTWRVPMIVKGPGIMPGGRAPGNIYLGDLLATFCELTGVSPVAHAHARSHPDSFAIASSCDGRGAVGDCPATASGQSGAAFSGGMALTR